MTLFFDLDGCLVDSRAAIAACINHALKTLGSDPRPERALYASIGPPLRTTFVELLGGERHADYAVQVYRDMYRERSLVDTVAVDGVAEVLAALAARQDVVIVTTKPRSFAMPIVDAVGLAPYVDDIVAPDLSATTEEKTATLRRAIASRRLDGAALAASWMVGDRGSDVIAGRANGVRTVAVTWGTGTRSELTAAAPDSIVSTPQQLLVVLTDDGVAQTGATA